MTTPTTLLTRIANFTGRHEDVAVEALGHILSQSKEARRALTGTLQESGCAGCTITRVKTQESVENGSVPDLTCYDERNLVAALIEAKFTAELTPRQPNSYLKALDETDCAALLFVAPEYRLEALWPEIVDRSKIEFYVDTVREVGSLRIARLPGSTDRYLMLTSWQHLLGAIDGEHCTDQTRNDIGQLQDLVERMEKSKFLPWQPDDMSSDVPTKLRSLRQVVDGAVERAKSHGHWLSEQNDRGNEDVEYGRYLWLNGVGIWFGVEFSRWAEHGYSPLWLELKAEYLPDDERVFIRINSQTVLCLEDSGYYYFPIALPTSTDLSGVITAVVEQLNAIARQINDETELYEQV